MGFEKDFETAIHAALIAGREIKKVYNSSNFEAESKDDQSPLTKADREANKAINDLLSNTPHPIISEENKQVSFQERESWNVLWMVDPLDGTKEFIKRNGEFTVNIALIKKGEPIFGVVYAPALGTFYYGGTELNDAWKIDNINEDFTIEDFKNNAISLKPTKLKGKVRVVGSRSHMNAETEEFITDLTQKFPYEEIEIVPKGSSLKLCLVAEGAADYYPRYAPTMEWDTAAGHAICSAVGVQVNQKNTTFPLEYNKEDLLNPHFLVSND